MFPAGRRLFIRSRLTHDETRESRRNIEESWLAEGIERMDYPFIHLLSLTRAWQVYLWRVTIGVNGIQKSESKDHKSRRDVNPWTHKCDKFICGVSQSEWMASGNLNPKVTSHGMTWTHWWTSHNSIPTLVGEIAQLYDEWRQYGNLRFYHRAIWSDAQLQPRWIKVLISTSMKTTSRLSLRIVSSRWPRFWLTWNTSRSWKDPPHRREATVKSERTSWGCQYFTTVNAVQE